MSSPPSHSQVQPEPVLPSEVEEWPESATAAAAAKTLKSELISEGDWIGNLLSITDISNPHSDIDHFSPKPDECVRGMKVKRAELAKLEEDYYSIIDVGKRNKDRISTPIEETTAWCKSVLDFRNRNGKWFETMSDNFVTHAWLDERRYTSFPPMLDDHYHSWNLILLDYNNLFSRWMSCRDEFDDIFTYAMLHEIAQQHQQQRTALKLYKSQFNLIRKSYVRLRDSPDIRKDDIREAELAELKTENDRLKEKVSVAVPMIGGVAIDPSPVYMKKPWNIVCPDNLDDKTRLEFFGYHLLSNTYDVSAAIDNLIAKH